MEPLKAEMVYHGAQPSPMVKVMRYFEMPIGQFKMEWAKLTDQDKEDLKKGIMDGTLTY
jgi:hypothetical protein